MRTTAPLPVHKPQPTHNRAAHTRAISKKEAADMRRTEAVQQSWQSIRKRGYKQALYRFTRHQYGHTDATPIKGTREIRAISHETGEIRTYWTQYEENIKFIANTDFLLHDKETTTYIVFLWTYENEECGRITTIRTASKGQKPTVETPQTDI